MRCTRNFGSAGSEFNVVHRGPVHADMIGIIDALFRNDSILNDARSNARRIMVDQSVEHQSLSRPVGRLPMVECC